MNLAIAVSKLDLAVGRACTVIDSNTLVVQASRDQTRGGWWSGRSDQILRTGHGWIWVASGFARDGDRLV